MDDLAFIERLWADLVARLRRQRRPAARQGRPARRANLKAAIGYYRATLGGVGLDPDPEVQALQDASAEPPPVPTLYLHGRTDGCMGAELAELAGAGLTTPGSRAEIVDGAGHFLHLERPDVVNRLIGEFLAEA